MKEYNVAEGDSTQSIAAKFGFESWKNIYEFVGNAPLRDLRGPNEIQPGDMVLIPNTTEAVTGASHSFVAKPAHVIPPVIFDAHMHIMSGNCTPLPPLYGLLADKGYGFIGGTQMSRGWVNRLGRTIAWLDTPLSLFGERLPTIGDWSPRSTFAIGTDTVSLNDSLMKVFKKGTLSKHIPDAKDDYLGISIVLTMDMDYAHIDGYGGDPIYHHEPGKDGSRYFYYKRTSGDPSAIGEKTYLRNSEWEMFETWEQQRIQTEAAAALHPCRLLPMYHFDPRRYLKNEEAADAFAQVLTKERAGVYVGFKMYTSQGFMPDDKRLSGVLDAYYARCVAEDIPIMTHCTPAGFYTHHRVFFLDWEESVATRDGYMVEERKKKAVLAVAETEYNTAAEAYSQAQMRSVEDGYSEESAQFWAAKRKFKKAKKAHEEADRLGRLKYFKEKTLHPDAWKPVLEKYPKLRLCLAHFASDKSFWENHGKESVSIKDEDKIDYERSWISSIVELCKKENVYTDISYLGLVGKKTQAWRSLGAILAGNENMLKKVMFGTDWYMILAEPVAYQDWFKNALEGLEKVQGMVASPVNLFYQFAIVNPLRFYRLLDIRPKLEKGLEDAISFHLLKPAESRLALKRLKRNMDLLQRLDGPLKPIVDGKGLVGDDDIIFNKEAAR